MDERKTHKEMLAIIHREYDRRLSFNTFIDRLRYNVAIQHEYIMNAVSYDEMILDLIELGELDPNILPMIKFKKDDNNSEV